MGLYGVDRFGFWPKRIGRGDPDERWEGMEPDRRQLVRDVARLVDFISEGQVLSLTRKDGNGFEPVLRWSGRRPELPGPGWLDEGPEPEEWWARLSESDREFFHQVAEMLWRLGKDMVLEFKKERGHLKAELLLKFGHPLNGGRAETN
jgi:hypothetical protein